MVINVAEINNLAKTFGSFKAVRGISFAIEKGEILGLLGANGAGKTTTIHMLLGLTRPTSGSIYIFGRELERHRCEVLERMNFASSYVCLPYNLRVWENLFVFARIYRLRKPLEQIEKLLAMFEIHHLRNRVTGMLSSGEQTRLNLCKALLNEPELLLLDEPTASLDPDMADKVRKALRKIQAERGITMLSTSHNMLDVAELCDRIIFMHTGSIIARGSPGEIMNRFASRSLEDLFITIARNGIVQEVDRV